MVYGVTRIDLPSCDWSDAPRAGAQGDLLPSFVAGPENRLAVSVLERLLAGSASSTVSSFVLTGPLVLTGPAGTGKSLLVRGIFRRWSELLGDEAVAYFTAADFGRELRAARSENNLNDFRRHLSEIKLLVVEDIHRLAESAFIQRELRDTLDVLSEVGSVVVLTARQLPALQSRLEFGLRDRLSGGLTLHLRYPGQEAREELLKLAAQIRGLPLSAARRHALAQKVSGPAPRLFSALTQQALGSCKGNSQEVGGVSKDTGVSKDNWVSNYYGASFEQGLDFKPIVALVARYFSLTQAALCSPGRRKSLVYARGIAIYLARSHTNLSYALIGKGLGNRDHTTVMNALKNIEKLLATDSATQRTIDELRRILCAA